MAEEIKVNTSLDLKGMLCPLPIVKVNQAVKGVPVGGIIEGIATDPGVQADIPSWCKKTGHELVTMEKQDGVFRFLVRRTR